LRLIVLLFSAVGFYFSFGLQTGLVWAQEASRLDI